MSVNQSHFWYGVFTNSSLEIFDKVPVLETIMSSYTQKVFPINSVDESSIEFEFETDRNIYLDMRDTYLSLKLQLFKGKEDCLMLSKKKKQNIKQNRRKIQMRIHKLT